MPSAVVAGVVRPRRAPDRGIGRRRKPGTAIPRCLIVISRERPALWHALVRLHAAHQDVEVILDRRVDLYARVPHGPNRRRAETAIPLESDGYLVILRSLA